MKKILLIFAIILTFTTYSLAAGSGGGNGSDNSSKKQGNAIKYKYAEKNLNKAKKYEKKNKLEKAEKHYKKAIEYLLEENKVNPANPDTFNYLGFAHRKIGDYKNAEIYYAIGLELDPTHVGINEYMGELFVVTNRMDLAKERLAVLKNCNCEEYEELKAVIEGKKKSKY
jgi:tetratricopeptide (TPR) repeat protein